MAVGRLNAWRHLIVAVAVCVGLALRIAFGLFYWVDKPLTHDEHEYLALASSLASGQGFTYLEPATGTTAQFGRAPGYPVFLALIGAGSTAATAAPTRVKIVQAVLGALSVWLIAVTAMRATGAASGVAAAWLAAVYPPLVWISSYVFSESLYSLLALAAALVLQLSVPDSVGRNSRTAPYIALASGLLTGVAILVRPAMLFFLPLAVLWLLLARRAARHAVALMVGVLIVVAPWTIRNAFKYDRFVLIASEGGVTFWTGNHPLAIGEGDLAANPELKRAELQFRLAHPGLTAEELEPLYYRDAFGHIASDPVWWAGLLGRKAFYTIVPAGPSYALHSTRYHMTSVISYFLLLPFAVAGSVTLWRRPSRPAAVLLLAGASALVCLIFFPQERFRIPVIDPVLIVCAAALAGRRPGLR